MPPHLVFHMNKSGQPQVLRVKNLKNGLEAVRTLPPKPPTKEEQMAIIYSMMGQIFEELGVGVNQHVH